MKKIVLSIVLSIASIFAYADVYISTQLLNATQTAGNLNVALVDGTVSQTAVNLANSVDILDDDGGFDLLTTEGYPVRGTGGGGSLLDQLLGGADSYRDDLENSKDPLATFLRELARKASKVWREHGALEYRECIGEDLDVKDQVPFPSAVKTEPGETVVFE